MLWIREKLWIHRKIKIHPFKKKVPKGNESQSRMILSSGGSVGGLRISARPIFFPWIDDNHCDRIHSFLMAVRCLDGSYEGNQPVTWKEYCVEY